MAEGDVEAAAQESDEATTDGLSESEKLDWIRLIRTETVGPVTFHALLEQFGSATAALEALPELSRRGGAAGIGAVCPLAEAERERANAEAIDARPVFFAEPDYPPLLRHIPAPPPLLYIRGDVELAARDTIAVVGSRHASSVGREFTGKLAADLGGAGIVIVSGLARGIDTAAHRAALRTGTIAVIAGGIDIIYPPENDWLHEAIAEQGLILTECPPGFAPRGQDFPRRNRIIAGLSSGTVVVEAAKKSGSLITARLAAEQGREVFAVPGHPLDPRALGTNGLIRGGAQLITSADDILDELFSSFHRRRPQGTESQVARAQPSLPPARARQDHQASAGDAKEQILAALGVTPVHPDLLLRQTGLSPRGLAVALLELDLAGRIERHDNEYVSLKPDLREVM